MRQKFLPRLVHFTFSVPYLSARLVYILVIVYFVLLMNQLAFSAVHEAGDTWTEPNTGMEFVYVPGGCYQMGCGNWTDNCDGDETPVHEVCVDEFWISKYEVTIEDYRQYLQATDNGKGVDFGSSYCPIVDNSIYSLSGNKFGTNGTQPMVEVNWFAGKAMTEWLTDNTSHTFRLPTEAEWEYAARSAGKKQKYAGGDDVDSLAWYIGNSGGQTHNVGTKDPNGLGIYNMSGNVWEWCSDSNDYYSNSPTDNPPGPDSVSFRVLRGGSWFSFAGGVRTACRGVYGPSRSNGHVGLRLVRTTEPQSQDSDVDGLTDDLESSSCTDPYDADSDDDGILDGDEDANHNGQIDAAETDPCNIDTNGDGIQDGTEIGLTLNDIGPDTDTSAFQPDIDPSTTTDPLNADSDGDGIPDGEEDLNHNGRVGAGESDPTDIQSLPVVKGDVNTDGRVNLKDAILCLQISCGMSSEPELNPAADVNGDGKIGLSEAVYGLQRIGGEP